MRRRSSPSRPAAPTPRRPDWRSYDTVAETYARVRGPVHDQPVRDLVTAVDPPEGGRVLDVGSGTGLAALAAVDRVGPAGLVVGADVSEGMLRVARQQGLRRPVAASAIDLPFRDRTFDAVLAAFVVFFFRRYETALHDMVRVLRPGGTMGVTTWGRSEDEFRRAWREVAESFVGRRMLADAHKRGAPWEDRFSDRNLLAEALHQAGLRQIRVDTRRYRVTQSLDDYLAGRETSVTGRFVRDMLGEALWERFRQRVSDEFRSRFPDPIGDSFDVLLATAVRE